MIKYNRIKIQFIHAGQKISRQALSGYKEIRAVTVTRVNGVRVEYFDGGIEWFPLDTLVYVLDTMHFAAA
ncbi:MAG: hypothetical protein HY306_03725 [Nitrosomonadales bacterium]|nr:hypothetical protein [Nitrosomonadales bacterium]